MAQLDKVRSEEMSMKKYIMTLIILIIFISSMGFLPTNGIDMSTISSNTDSACYTVTGEINQTPNEDGNLAGTISGDLVGTILTIAGPVEIHGIVIFRDIEQTWFITGGIVEDLIGRTLLFENEFRGIINDYPMLKVNTTGRLIDGAQRGNITLHGWTNLTPPITNYLEYHGVICP